MKSEKAVSESPPSRNLEKEIIKGVKNQKNQESKKPIKLPTSNKIVLEALCQNEDGDAYLFIKLVKDRYIYDHIRRDWYYWNDHYWRRDKINHVITLIKEVIKLYGDQEIFERLSLQQAEKDGDEEKIKNHKYLKKMLEHRIDTLRTLKRKEIVLKLSRAGLNSLGLTEQWDNKPTLLACKNGCIDLKKGEFKLGVPTDYLKTAAPVTWEGIDAPCQIWKDFLLQMFNKDILVVDYIQRLLGYGITGLNTEHIFPIFWGENGRNGKSTLFGILEYVLGELAYKAPSSFLMQQSLVSNSGSLDAVTAWLQGKRIVWCAETNESDRLDVAKLKELVGGDTISTRIPYAKEQIQFIPTHLFLTITNRCPKVPANDRPLWKRIHLIPLINSFIDNPDPKNPYEFKADKDLLKKLKKEAPGILAWLVEGCLIWQLEGLNPPDSVNSATEQYRKKEDIIGDFIRECCVQAENEFLRVEPKLIYKNYKEWCEEVGHHYMSKKRFLNDLRNRFKMKKSNGVNYFLNIGFA